MPTIVGFVAGFGETVGYGLRSVSGYFADKTYKYWAVTFVGYAINTLAVPALALAGNWPLAAALVIAERTGRAVRKPAVESMLSHAGQSIGQGWVFGLNEAMDQTGATLGPLITAWVLYRRGGYHHAFAVLLNLRFAVPDRTLCGVVAIPPTRGFAGKIRATVDQQRLPESLLALSGSGSVDCRGICRLLPYRFSFPEKCNGCAGSGAGFLCRRHGYGRYRLSRLWKTVG